MESSNGDAVPGAQVLIEPVDGGGAFSTYANAAGVFRFAYAPARFFLRANAVSFQPAGRPVDLIQEPPIGRLRLEPKASSEETETTVVTSGPLESGWGASWSSVYEVCADARPGFRIRSHSFRLKGDRSCGAWADCSPTQNSDSRVCWGFRLQGHSELVALGQGARQSEGVLEVVLERTQRRSRGATTVFIQCTDQTEPLAKQLRARLVSDGWRVAELQSLSAPFFTRIVLNSGPESDASETHQLLQTIQAVVAQDRERTPLPIIAAGESDAPTGTIEVWLTRQITRQTR